MKIGFSSLSFGLVGAAGPNGPRVLEKVANELNMGVQLVMHRDWEAAPTVLALGPYIVSMERLFIKEQVFRPFYDEPASAERVYSEILAQYPHVPDIGYEPHPQQFIHVVSEICAGWWPNALGLHQTGKVRGFVMDTCHTLTPRQGLSPVANSPEDFAAQCRRLLQTEIPWLLHLQPSRFPQNGKMFVVSNMFEVFQLIQGHPQSRLATMLHPLKGITSVPIIIEIDPKIGFFLRRSGMVSLLARTRDAIYREIS